VTASLNMREELVAILQQVEISPDAGADPTVTSAFIAAVRPRQPTPAMPIHFQPISRPIFPAPTPAGRIGNPVGSSVKSIPWA
jgi:hypothetical protein